jgi:hypothetical protein
MARGIGGDDGPSIWMAVAVICVWGYVKTQVNSAKKTVVAGLELGQNSAGPLQEQTSADIAESESAVKSWHCTWSALPKPKTYYQNIANKLWTEMRSSFNIDEAAMIAMCKPLTTNELMAVAICFGVKEATTPFFGLTTWTGHIFQAFDVALEGYFKSNDRAAMKKIWAPTKLW